MDDHDKAKLLKPIEDQNARHAIDGAIEFGRLGVNRPPTDDHWLMPYWKIGKQLASQDIPQVGVPVRTREPGNVKPDDDKRVFFYEQEFYVLSNFSAFRLKWRGIDFDTSEAAYHWEKFPEHPNIRAGIIGAASAHEAFKLAESGKKFGREDWDAVKVDIMRGILWEKAAQHEYVRRKLLQTGDRALIEDSWRDGYWGWGADKLGQNMLGKLWMEVRAELREPVGKV